MSLTPDHTNVFSVRERERADALCALLVQQIAGAREGHLIRVERLGLRAAALVAEMRREQGAAAVLTEAQRKDLRRLYGQLRLALEAQRSEAEAELKQLRRVKRAVGAYGRKGVQRSAGASNGSRRREQRSD
jgi:hypothetical protein